MTSQSRLIQLIQDRAQSGVFLSVLGFGKGNYNDSMMEKLADKGNGNYAYIDSLLEARKVLVEQIGGTLVTIAKDVKIQIDFNPTRVIAYRLIGYENRLLDNEDFRDDSKDAGELGAGHTVTALYEIVPAGVESPARKSKPSKFVETVPLENVDNDQLLHVSLRYKLPESERGREFSTPLMHADGDPLPAVSTDFQFAISVATFGMLLRDSKFAGSADWDWVIETAEKNLGTDHNGMSCSEIRVHPGGKHVYTANRDVAGKGRDSISVFEVQEGGKLKLIQVEPAKVEIPRNINLSPGGNWLLVAGQRSGNVPVFRIGKDGKLKFSGNEVKVANAMCVEFLK